MSHYLATLPGVQAFMVQNLSGANPFQQYGCAFDYAAGNCSAQLLV
jgi:hypothetical protein